MYQLKEEEYASDKFALDRVQGPNKSALLDHGSDATLYCKELAFLIGKQGSITLFLNTQEKRNPGLAKKLAL